VTPCNPETQEREMSVETRDQSPSSLFTLAMAWLAVGLPLIWGVTETVRKAAALFR
jgi:hypothetical protein